MAIVVKIPGVPGDCKIDGYDKGEHFMADSFSFGVEREFKESGEKGGTTDINIGVGELQECSISKSMDKASAKLAQFAINGNSLGTAEIDFVEIGGGGGVEGKPVCYLRYKLDRCFVKTWSTSGDADDRPTEEVAFWYNKIAFQYLTTPDGKTFQNGGFMNWDNVKNTPWDSHGINLLSQKGLS
jgi:type VI protein secretion system component Hcp